MKILVRKIGENFLKHQYYPKIWLLSLVNIEIFEFITKRKILTIKKCQQWTF